MNPALRPMTTAELLDRTVQLYRRHFWLFAGIATVGPALSLMVEILTWAIFGPAVARGNITGRTGSWLASEARPD